MWKNLRKRGGTVSLYRCTTFVVVCAPMVPWGGESDLGGISVTGENLEGTRAAPVHHVVHSAAHRAHHSRNSHPGVVSTHSTLDHVRRPHRAHTGLGLAPQLKKNQGLKFTKWCKYTKGQNKWY